MSIKNSFLINLPFPVIILEVAEEQLLLPEIEVELPEFPPSFLM